VILAMTIAAATALLHRLRMRRPGPRAPEDCRPRVTTSRALFAGAAAAIAAGAVALICLSDFVGDS
jgi:hypothetical protein